MAGFFGADVEQLHLLERVLSQQAEQLEAVVSRLSARITSVEWRGPDAQKFKTEWQDHLSGNLRASANRLRDASGQVAGNARQQEEASGRLGGAAPPTAAMSPFPAAFGQVPADFVWKTTRDAVNQRIPGTSWNYGDVGAFVPGADRVLSTRDYIDSIQQGKVPFHELVDTTAGMLRMGGPIKGGAVAYTAGAAIGIWNTVGELAVEADFPNTWQTNMDYIASDPMGALQGAADGIVSGLPRILKNFKFW